MEKLSINEMEQLVGAGGNYLVDFYADWCSPCKAIAPVLEEISNQSDVKVIKIDVDIQEREALEKYNIRSIPTIYAFKNGEAVDKMVGSQTKARLMKNFV